MKYFVFAKLNLDTRYSTLSTLMRGILLAICLACAIATGAQAQLAYNFQTPDDIPASTSGTHPNIITMDCLAANGYGQWTSSSSTTNTNGAASGFLLSNKLTTSTTTDAQAGVLAAKTFQYNGTDVYPTEAIKSAANLTGNVRYVWLDNTSGRDKFYVEGFDPASTTNASTGIGIDFVGLGQSYGTNSQKIVKDNNANLYVEGVIHSMHTLVSATNEPLYPDMFDIAIDANYLYIVWEEYASSTYTIHAAYVNLSTSAVTLFGSVGSGFVANGRRPTVSVDVRHSGGVADIDVAYISAIPGGQVEWTEWNGTSWSTPINAPGFVTGQTWSWINATHARILDASTPGSGTADKAIYFIAQDNSGNVSLYFNRIVSGAFAMSTDYCDGQLNTDRADPGSPYVCPVETSTGFDVIDDYIRAFINPYDGSTTSGAFNHFNCLYVLNRTTGSAGGKYPIMIIQGSDPDSGYCVSGGNTLGSFTYDDPIKNTTNEPFAYVGAANQMGIHVHWTGLSNSHHYYRRNAHAFDQDIEENTLLTAGCEVSGSVTLTNKWLTLYADPAGTTGYTGGGSLTIDNSVKLAINPSGGGGDFVAIGAVGINFVSIPGGIIEVDADDQMDFYGNTHSGVSGVGEFKFTGSGDYMVSNGYGSWPDAIYDPATLNIHGGSFIDVGITGEGASYFTCNDAIIHLNYETNVVTGSGNAEGLLILNDHSSFTQCMIYSDDNNAADDPTAIDIAANGYVAGPTGNADYNAATPTYATDTFEQCAFYGGTGDSHATMEVSDPNVAPNSLLIDNGWVSGWSIKGGNYLYWPIIVTDVTFYEVIEDGLDISFATTPPTADAKLYSLLVDGCGFQGYGDFTDFSNPDGIKVENAPDATLDDGLRESITITNNTFESTNYFEPAGGVEAAIHFSDATGDIGYNNISGAKYQRGVWNESSVGGSDQTTWTLICSNTITGLTHTGAAGLSTDYYIGYAKMNSITDGYIGHLSGEYDNGHDISSTYTGNFSYGYDGVLNSITDMAGVHHPSDPSTDVAAYNVITSNNSSGTQIALSGATGNKIYLGLEPGTPTWPTDGLITHKKTSNPQSSMDLPDSTCGALFTLGYGLASDPTSEPAGYDTLRLFLEQCPFYGDTGGFNPDNSWDAFSFINGAVSGWTAGGSGRWPDFLAFLKQVLYLNPDTSWYCQDVGDMITAMQYDETQKLSELQYLLQSGKCQEFSSAFQTLYNSASHWRHQYWLDSIVTRFDTVQYYGHAQWWVDSMVNIDTLANPYDSTIPSLQQVGLEILLGPQSSVQEASSPFTSQALLNATLLDNPMQDEIDISFDMGRTALVTMELRDILGREVPLTFGKYQLEQPGTHSARIPVPNLPSGTYYLRITTDTGDIITLKVVKQ